MTSISGLSHHVDSKPHLASWQNNLLSAVLAASFGLVLIYGAAFANVSALHNAAHDGRHSAGFPCH